MNFSGSPLKCSFSEVNDEKSVTVVTLEEHVTCERILLHPVRDLREMRGTYEGVSVNYLIKAGALQNDKAPLGGESWSVTSSIDGSSFLINLVDLTNGECNYFASKKPSWATKVLVNGFETDISSNCFNSATNQVSFVVQ